jgi:hypothetical protein
MEREEVDDLSDDLSGFPLERSTVDDPRDSCGRGVMSGEGPDIGERGEGERQGNGTAVGESSCGEFFIGLSDRVWVCSSGESDDDKEWSSWSSSPCMWNTGDLRAWTGG